MPLNPATYTACFISEQALKDASIINENVDMKILTPTITLIQDLYILRYLGTGLYVDLQNKIALYESGNTDALNADEKFLLNAYIQPLMIWGVMFKAPIVLTYKYMNKGVEKQSSDNSTPAPVEELEKLVDEAKDNFDNYAQRIILYLNANQSLFPSYNVVRTMDDVAPSVRGFRSKLYIGSGREGTGVCDPNFFYR